MITILRTTCQHVVANINNEKALEQCADLCQRWLYTICMLLSLAAITRLHFCHVFHVTIFHSG